MQPCSKIVFFEDLAFRVSENVYEPAEDSFLLARNLRVRKGDVALDVGTGCGILGILAAREANTIVAVDINPHAVRCAKENAELNAVQDKVSLLQGDLFTPIKTGRSFDLILFNAPYLPSEREEGSSWAESAWAGGADGRQVIDRFIYAAPQHLKTDGRILLLQSTLSGVEKSSDAFHQNGLKTEIVAEQTLPFFETIVLMKATYTT